MHLVICMGNPQIFFAIPGPVPALGAWVQPQIAQNQPQGQPVPIPIMGNPRVLTQNTKKICF
jgi:hypothetical protein